MRRVVHERKSWRWLVAASAGAVVSGALALAPAGAHVEHPTRRPATATIEICESPAHRMAGKSFLVSLDGAAPVTVLGGQCSAPIATEPGDHAVGETPTAGLQVVGIQADRAQSKDLANGTVVVRASRGSKAGGNTVTFVNRAVRGSGPAPKGDVEVCTKADDNYVHGAFEFTIAAPGFTSDQTVTVGQCSDAVEVPAGEVSISETARFPYFTRQIDLEPTNRLVHENAANGTITLSVPAGGASTESLVTFVTATHTGLVQVCKALSAGSTDLAGRPFSFTVTSAVGHPQHETVIAGGAGTTMCGTRIRRLPLGSPVSITENDVAGVQAVAVVVSPPDRDTGSGAPTARFTVGTGVTAATFTDQALGTLELCTAAADPSTATQTFRFSVDGGPALSVPAGQCSQAITVPAGSASVTQLDSTNFHLVGVAARGPRGDDRLTSAPTDNPAVVSVPYGGVESETVVKYTDAVDTGELEICEESPEPTLQDVTFEFTYDYTVYGVAANGTASLTPGQCSALSGAIPVVDPSGAAVAVSVTELPHATVDVADIAVANGTLTSTDLAAGGATVTVNRGVTAVSFTNLRTPFGTIILCDHPADDAAATQTFLYSVNDGPTISVPSGGCSHVFTVLSGTATVASLDAPNFHVVDVAARGPLGDDRLRGAPTDAPALVAVPPGDSTNATTVTFDHAVDTARLEICNASAEPSLQGVPFTFDYQDTRDGGANGTASVEPGRCSDPSDPVPVVGPDGRPVELDVLEAAVPGVVVSAVEAENGTVLDADLANGQATISLAPGETTIVFTNGFAPQTTVRRRRL